MPVDHPGPVRPRRTQDGGHPLGHPPVAHPDQLVTGAARVGQWPEKVEGRGHTELAARRAHVAHGGVVAGGKQKPIPASSMQRATAAGGRAISTPSASSTSAEPVREDAARPPCLQTGTPAPATTRAAMVETLMVPARSPPVPQVSTSRARTSSGTGTVSATSSMAPNMPVSSSDVSPLHRNPNMNAAICEGLAAPSRISRNAAADSSELEVVARGHTPEERRPTPQVGQAERGHGPLRVSRPG